jgi:hypothetical protein
MELGHARLAEHPEPDVRYADNYVTLFPGRPQTIRARHPHEPLDAGLFDAKTLFDPCSLIGELTRS